jgi:hypothetical protein
MSARINLLKEAEIPAPHEKLLRAPTVSEKYGWLKWFFIVVVIVGVMDYGIIKVLNSDNSNKVPSPVQNAAIKPSTAPLAKYDPTTNWNSYNNPGGKFSFKYPDGYTVTENVSKNSVQLASNKLSNNSEFVLTISFKPVMGNTELQTLVTKNPFCPTISSEKPTPSTINGERAAQLYADLRCAKTPTSVIYTVNQDMLYIMTIQSKTQFMDIKSYTDQILSTLSFSQETKQMNPGNKTVCTMEAKLCPDGSSVGRTGPNCEFAACPAK